jgi:hypothetical protein
MLDLEIATWLSPEGRERLEKDEWFDAMATGDAAASQIDHVPEVKGAPSVDAGNTSEAAAIARLMALTGKDFGYDKRDIPTDDFEPVDLMADP